MSTSSDPIERSFEIAASRCADLTPLVYQRLFEQHPETRTMFRAQGRALVMESMLALTIAFFTIIRDTLRGLLGDEWSADMAQAWDRLLPDIDTFATAPA
ncbi:globin [Bradyrhizobium sp. CB2312]|uniref:globin n=1 Tax=Bradyrhizobium sp. CB2312 TaxID=3039155 RepID=UPI0024B12B20|nr:globin [Bradyrhizobium sp. CB2312]WFU76753.1 globin [Bradyrhizobium sp. CB2312]